MVNKLSFDELYPQFDQPIISSVDCGQECAPYNENGVPFCCDTQHSIPAAYQSEWCYLQARTDLWHLWQPPDAELSEELRAQTPDDMLLIECLGSRYCQRDYRSIACRAFPFFPYSTQAGQFIGISYYWEYEDRCWMINHLDRVDEIYRQQFVVAFETLFNAFPQERQNFAAYSADMRMNFAQQRRFIPLLHRNGKAYKITPSNERMRLCAPSDFLKFEPYSIVAQLLFPDEL